jgi:GH24 family phage-related lysozyme (muramidase)
VNTDSTKSYQQTIEMLAQWKCQMTSIGRNVEVDARAIAVVSFIYNVGEKEISRAISDKVLMISKRAG